MRTIEREIERSASFKRDYNVMKRDEYALELLEQILFLLAWDKELPKQTQDHVLIGDWVGYGECHVKPDLLLIYKKPDSNSLRLARIAPYSELCT